MYKTLQPVNTAACFYMLPTVCVTTCKKPHLRSARLYVHRIKNQDQRLHKVLFYAPLFYAFLLLFLSTNLHHFLKHLPPLPPIFCLTLFGWFVEHFLCECQFRFTHFLFTLTFSGTCPKRHITPRYELSGKYYWVTFRPFLRIVEVCPLRSS